MTALVLALALSAPQDPGFNLPIEEFVLENKMRVLIIPRKGVPLVDCSLCGECLSACPPQCLTVGRRLDVEKR